MGLKLPRLYPIIDTDCLRRAGATNETLLPAVIAFAQQLVAAGATVLQYRAKAEPARVMLSHARELRRVMPDGVTLIMNDRADLCLAAGFQGVHVGQDDLSVAGVRSVVGSRIVGTSTHNVEQFRAALATDADYIAIGPIFETASKERPDPIVGLELVRAARAELAARKDGRPLVAIGGITKGSAADVIRAGADSVALISELVKAPRQSFEQLSRILL